MIFSDLLNFNISEGSIENILQRAYENGEYLHSEILQNVKKQSWIGADETGVRVEAKKWWLWVWQNLKGSFYSITDNRGYKTIKELFGENYGGRMVHDCWMAQFKTPAKGGHQPVKGREEIRMKERFLKYKDNVLFFMQSSDMPYHNNSSEQAIRMAKIKQKVSYGFRSKNGAQRYAVLLSIIETCKKQDLSIFESLKTLILNKPLRFHWVSC